jgi:hypothetical protein
LVGGGVAVMVMTAGTPTDTIDGTLTVITPCTVINILWIATPAKLLSLLTALPNTSDDAAAVDEPPVIVNDTLVLPAGIVMVLDTTLLPPNVTDDGTLVIGIVISALGAGDTLMVTVCVRPTCTFNDDDALVAIIPVTANVMDDNDTPSKLESPLLTLLNEITPDDGTLPPVTVIVALDLPDKIFAMVLPGPLIPLMATPVGILMVMSTSADTVDDEVMVNVDVELIVRLNDVCAVNVPTTLIGHEGVGVTPLK